MVDLLPLVEMLLRKHPMLNFLDGLLFISPSPS